MLTKLVKRLFMPVLLLVLLWPTPTDYYLRLGLAVCVAVVWARRVRRSKYVRQAARIPASPKVKYEN
jgi:membrane protein implicated in regulation of membrane protease activity